MEGDENILGWEETEKKPALFLAPLDFFWRCLASTWRFELAQRR